MPRRLNRVTPRGPVAGMVTYGIRSPISTHTRPGTCEEVNCPQWRDGWTTIVPAGSDQADLLAQVERGHSPDGIRRVPYAKTPDGGNVQWYYAAGTPCFRATAHRVSLDRPEIYIKRAGDWRRDLGLIRKHDRPEHWVEDFATNQDRVSKIING